jgi:hypothetical protein
VQRIDLATQRFNEGAIFLQLFQFFKTNSSGPISFYNNCINTFFIKKAIITTAVN